MRIVGLRYRFEKDAQDTRVIFAIDLVAYFTVVARDGFGLLLVELGVAKFARVAYRNILDEVC